MVEQFDRGHFLSRFRGFDPVSHQKESSVYPEDGGMDLEEKSNPRPGEDRQIQGLAVEEIQNPIIAAFLQAQGAHYARCALQV